MPSETPTRLRETSPSWDAAGFVADFLGRIREGASDGDLDLAASAHVAGLRSYLRGVQNKAHERVATDEAEDDETGAFQAWLGQKLSEIDAVATRYSKAYCEIESCGASSERQDMVRRSLAHMHFVTRSFQVSLLAMRDATAAQNLYLAIEQESQRIANDDPQADEYVIPLDLPKAGAIAHFHEGRVIGAVRLGREAVLRSFSHHVRGSIALYLHFGPRLLDHDSLDELLRSEHPDVLAEALRSLANLAEYALHGDDIFSREVAELGARIIRILRSVDAEIGRGEGGGDHQEVIADAALVVGQLLIDDGKSDQMRGLLAESGVAPMGESLDPAPQLLEAMARIEEGTFSGLPSDLIASSPRNPDHALLLFRTIVRWARLELETPGEAHPEFAAHLALARSLAERHGWEACLSEVRLLELLARDGSEPSEELRVSLEEMAVRGIVRIPTQLFDADLSGAWREARRSADIAREGEWRAELWGDLLRPSLALSRTIRMLSEHTDYHTRRLEWVFARMIQVLLDEGKLTAEDFFAFVPRDADPIRVARTLREVARVHDFGKVIMPHLVNFVGSFTPEEREAMCQHGAWSFRILAGLLRDSVSAGAKVCPEMLTLIAGSHHHSYRKLTSEELAFGRRPADFPGDRELILSLGGEESIHALGRGDEIPLLIRLFTVADQTAAGTEGRRYMKRDGGTWDPHKKAHFILDAEEKQGVSDPALVPYGRQIIDQDLAAGVLGEHYLPELECMDRLWAEIELRVCEILGEARERRAAG